MRRTVDPAEPVVSLADAKGVVRVGFAADDAEIAACIDAATGHLDGWHGVLGRCLVTQTWQQARVEGEPFCPPFPDMGAVTEVTADGVTTATFTAGFGGASAVPAPIKRAILLHVQLLYDAGLTDKAAVAALAPGGMYQMHIAPFRVFAG